MATIYFTNNADSGDGSLRNAWTNASDGDVVMPDPNSFIGDTIEILLASRLTARTINLTLDGGTKRIVLNGQGTNDFFRAASAGYALTFKNVDFKNGYRSGYGPVYISAVGAMAFERCAFYGNVGASTAAFIQVASTGAGSSFAFTSSIGYGNGSSGQARIVNAANCTVNVSGCTFYSLSFYGTITNVDSLISGDDGVDFSTLGFVDASNYDFRLTAASSILTGGTLTGTDFLGHARTGSKGAYDGSWLVGAESVSVAATTSVDYLDSPNVLLTGGAVLNVRGALVRATLLSASDSTFAYVAVPDLALATSSGRVVVAKRNCSITSVSGSVSVRAATASYQGDEGAALLAVYDDASVQYVGSTFTTNSDLGFVVRAFDGEFHDSERIPRTYYLKDPTVSTASFADKTAWTMDEERTLDCNATPAIVDGSFYCCYRNL